MFINDDYSLPSQSDFLIGSHSIPSQEQVSDTVPDGHSKTDDDDIDDTIELEEDEEDVEEQDEWPTPATTVDSGAAPDFRRYSSLW